MIPNPLWTSDGELSSRFVVFLGRDGRRRGAFKANKGSIFPFSAKRSAAAAATGIQWTQQSPFNRGGGGGDALRRMQRGNNIARLKRLLLQILLTAETGNLRSGTIGMR